MAIDFRKELNDEQYRVVTEADGPCLVLAGAGSGKTRTITYRVAYLLERGVHPDEILLVTFTNKAAREMIQRIGSLIKAPYGREGVQLPWAGTFHHIGVKILRAHASRTGFTRDFTILDEDDAESMLSSAAREVGASPGRNFPSVGFLRSLLSFSRNALCPLEEVVELRAERFVPLCDTIGEVARRYAEKKRAANVMDFDDILIYWHALLEEHREVRDTFARAFRAILVDEYQDTNAIQAAILKELASHHRNILVVGDDAQSIYSFRAAEIKNILDFEREYKGARIFRLETNYRSVPQILLLANALIRENASPYPKELKPVVPKGKVKPRLLLCADPQEEAAMVADHIEELHAHGIALHEIAVLFRAAFHAQALEVECVKRGIPYDFRGGLRFFERAHVKDILAFLRIYTNVHDAAAWARLLKLQQGVGEATARDIIAALGKFERFSEVVLYDVVAEVGPRARGGWEAVIRVATAMIEAEALKSGKPNPGKLIMAVLNAFYRAYLEESFDDAEDRIADLERLAQTAARAASLEGFLTEASLSEEYATRRRERQGEERIVLSTIHQAKGLEWDAVHVINLAHGALPNERALTEPGGVEEERRLLYVAITRARVYLHLSVPLTQPSGAIATPSQFLGEIDQKMLEVRREALADF